METVFDIILDIINIIGIISFAAAGAMIAIDKETDLFGVIFLSIITCFGGGILRDMIAGHEVGRMVPIFFTELKMEIIVCVLTALVVFLLAFLLKEKYVREEATVEKINNILDALGLGVFASVGTAAYITLGPFIAITMGFISSVGGSLIRDTLLRDIPFILRKRVYAVASILGSAVYYLIFDVFMKGMKSAGVVATISCMVVIFAIRMCATIFRWNMPRAIDFSKISVNEQDKKEVVNTKK
ncbi:MAG: TRIC cation channel family protein [Clostridia bacterium]|nr:TRIC cation channel family protein [Clostridia bacterium]